MPNERIIYRLEIDGDNLNSEAARAGQEVRKLRDNIKGLNDSLKRNQRSQREVSQSLKDLQAEGKDTSAEYRELQQTQRNLTRENSRLSRNLESQQSALTTANKNYRSLQRALNSYTDDAQKNFKIIEAQGGSLNQISSALRQNELAYRNLSQEQRENSSEGGRLRKTILDQREALKTAEAAVGDFRRGVGDYRNAIRETVGRVRDLTNQQAQARREFGKNSRQYREVTKELQNVKKELRDTRKAQQDSIKAQDRATLSSQDFTVAVGNTRFGLNSLRRGFQAATAAVRTFTAALLSNPLTAIAAAIGVVIGALFALVRAYFRTVEGSDRLSRTTARLEVAFGRFIGRMEVWGQSIVEFFDGVGRVFRSVGNAITFLFNRTEGINRFVEDSAEGLEEMGDAAETTAQRLASLRIELEETTIANTRSLARLRRDYEAQRILASDRSLDPNIRLIASREAERISRSIADIELESLNIKKEIFEIENSLNDTSREDLLLEQENLAAIDATEAAQNKRVRTLRTERASITAALNKGRVDSAVESNNEILDNERLFQDQLQQIQNESLDLQEQKKLEAFENDLERDRYLLEQKRLTYLAELNELEITEQQKQVLRDQYNNEVFLPQLEDLNNQIAAVNKKSANEELKTAGEVSKAKGSATLSELDVKATAAIAETGASVPFPLNIPLIALVTALYNSLKTRLIGQVAKLGNVATFEEGGLIPIGGRRHAQGGTRFVGDDGTVFEAEKGEAFVLNRGATKHLLPYFSQINEQFGGKSFNIGSNYLQSGGRVEPSMDIDRLAVKIGQQVARANANLPNPVVSVEDINNGQRRVATVTERSFV